MGVEGKAVRQFRQLGEGIPATGVRCQCRFKNVASVELLDGNIVSAHTSDSSRYQRHSCHGLC